ncbi:hypothetical protein [Celerinatantimonas diazotrophica]|uniref:hypothetical protein n=1 Tax=Celerinatantimonas diazotrophica TaxID=412034 RepID=UPI001042B7D6|nr:hypothetical protein [Celerinatantimonas diazotrophica]CAG9296306.1 hypothetical protein CEDIAZO_01454 [Celerinatantimonas diazotrophica]
MFKLTAKNTELLLARLKSWHLKDGNSTKGDSLSLTINSSNIDGIPLKGEQYTVYLDDIKRDVFQITQRMAAMQPRAVQIELTVAPFMADSSEFLKRQSASRDNTTLAQIVSDVVTPFGYDIFVHP